MWVLTWNKCMARLWFRLSFLPKKRMGSTSSFITVFTHHTPQWNSAFFHPAKGTQKITLLEHATVNTQTCYGGAEPEILLLSSKFPIYMCQFSSQPWRAGMPSFPGPEGLMFSLFQQITGPQCNVLNHISFPCSLSSMLSLQPGAHHYCRNSRQHPSIQKQHLLFLPVYWRFFWKQNAQDKTNKSIRKAFKWMCSHYKWYQGEGMQTGQSVAWCF